MHDVGGTSLISRPDLPTNDMSMVDHRKDPAMDSDFANLGPEGVDMPEQSSGDIAVNTSSDQTGNKPATPQPVTPETPKFPADNAVEEPPQTIEKDKNEQAEPVPPPQATCDVTTTSSGGSSSVKKNLENLSLGDVRPKRDRVVSLDRAREPIDADGYNSPDSAKTDDERHRRHVQERSFQSKRDAKSKNRPYDDASSSDDDSSYFATHLPSPKSGRSFSYSSSGSAHAHATSSLYQNSISRESDASLSFSDESDDDMQQKHGVHISPMIPPKGSVADMHLYPQRITRMHSVSSLVSSGSSEDEKRSHPSAASRRSSSSISSHTTAATSSDPSVRNELHDVAVAAEDSANHLIEASGRRSPIMGQHASPGYSFASPSPSRMKQSPPPIMQGYVPPTGMPHPQPQPMSKDQMAAWVTAGNVAAHSYQAGQPHPGYGSTMQLPQQGLPGMIPHQGGFRNLSDNSTLSVPFVYSEDDEVADAPPMNRMAGALPLSGGLIPMAGGGNGSVGQQRQIPSDGNPEGLQSGNGSSRLAARVASEPGGGAGGEIAPSTDPHTKGFQVYRARWIMLFYMSALNLLSDWTCYSVAPIALLTEEAFGNIDPERLVVIFLGANAVATACEPIILSRLGLRRTVLFGSLLLMIGSIIKSGGVPPILQSDLQMGHDEWRLYLGFFVVGLSQPLYQCTPALLSASWFPEKERTMATGVALNANQLGIGFAFIFGTLLVATKEDIIPYFGLLSTISTIVFMGTLIQFDDAPPTPPSSSARVMRGSLEVNLPSIDTIVQSVRGLGGLDRPNQGGIVASPSPAASHPVGPKTGSSKHKKDSKTKKSNPSSTGRKRSSTRRRATGSRFSQTANTDNGLAAPSSARFGPTAEALAEITELKMEAKRFDTTAPSPAMPGRVGQPDGPPSQGDSEGSSLYEDAGTEQDQQGLHQQAAMGENPMFRGQPPMGENPMFQGQPQMGENPMFQGQPPMGENPMFQGQPQMGENPMFQGQPGTPGGPPLQGMVPPFGALPHPPYQYPYWDPRVQQQMQQQQAYYQQQYFYYQQAPQQAPQQARQPPPVYYPMAYPHHLQGYDFQNAGIPAAAPIDEGAEPIITITPHHLDIDIRDDQVIRSLRACFARPGFIHALVAFAVSGIVINTLSTYMDYLVSLNGAPRSYTGIVGGTFQFVIMISSLIIGKQTDKTRAYYSVAIGMLVLGAFGLAECGVSLDANRGSDLRWSLIVVAALVGPLQPVSTELGVDVVYPLSENTVLVVQQLFSNLLSAMFIPLFKLLKDVGSSNADETDLYERPEYTFSFYLLIVLHTAATVFFATFNGKYLRYEHELQRDAEEERRALEADNAFHHPFHDDQEAYMEAYENERQPLIQGPIV